MEAGKHLPLRNSHIHHGGEWKAASVIPGGPGDIASVMNGVYVAAMPVEACARGVYGCASQPSAAPALFPDPVTEATPGTRVQALSLFPPLPGPGRPLSSFLIVHTGCSADAFAGTAKLGGGAARTDSMSPPHRPPRVPSALCLSPATGASDPVTTSFSFSSVWWGGMKWGF